MKLVLAFGMLLTLLMGVDAAPAASAGAKETGCEPCHQKLNPGLYGQWKSSAHGREGVSCKDCHGAQKGDRDAFMHEGALIATLVTPRDCGECHADEEAQVTGSHHALAGEILGSQDAFLAEVAGGHPAAIMGCESCHGCRVKIDSTRANRLSPESWPNSGIGRINPDGSKGACNACHTRHSFSLVQAREPDNCGKCHLGPDHPQKEIYEESKHGIAYKAHQKEMGLDRPSWVVGVDYYQAPTCATCHMSATRTQKTSHDVGSRISWTLRPAVSAKQSDWSKKRDRMKDVCSACHEMNFVNGHYTQFDALTRMYNDKFGAPATEVYNLVTKKGLREREVSFGNQIDWQYYELWHHEGRRARMGAAMMGPDYTWWHGIYEVAHNFYFDFIPSAQAFGDKEVSARIDSLLKKDPMHAWLGRTTQELRTDIRSGKLPAVYEHLLRSEATPVSGARGNKAGATARPGNSGKTPGKQE